MTENPYEVSSLYLENRERKRDGGESVDSGWYFVDGSDLICHRILRLPKTCIFMGTDSDLILEWRGVRPWFYWPSHWRKCRCLVFFRVERQRWQKHQRLKRLAEGLSVGLFTLTGLAVTMSREVEQYAVTLGMFVVLMVFVLQFVAHRLNNPLRYVSREDNLFRITGFGPDAIKRLQELQPNG